MSVSRWLRSAAALTLFQAVAHTVGAVLAGPSQGAAEVALRESMRAYRVTMMGVERSYWDFYFGSGWTITALLLAVAAVMWLLVPVARDTPRNARPIIAALAVSYGAVTVISALFFVTAPIIVAAVVTLCLVGAFVTAKRG
jgi:hypothetical protein